MTTLVFLAALAAIFLAVVMAESERDGAVALHRPTGLLTWVARGNWPAKLGGLLVLVGFGALLRYAVLNIDVPDFAKLAAGVVLSLALGFLSTVIPEGPARRPVSLALGGAAFGVAYLTVYSAFALFGYLRNPLGLGLLGLTSVAAAAYAVQRSALSLAVLSMVGAFMAPAFAPGDPGPQVVYGYYLGAGALTLVMVILRGWRPLIHLSFLFTLAGGVFFAWTSRYFAPPHTDTMLVFLLGLTALHVAMPLLEKPATRLPWIESLDFLYLIALPVVAVLVAFFLASGRTQFSTEVLLLAGIWAIAAAMLAAFRREGALAHAAIAGLLAALAIAVRFRELPWELLLLGVSVGALGLAAWRRRPVERLHGTLAGSAVLFGALHMLDAAGNAASGPAFANGAFAERVVGAVLLIVAGAICRRIRQSLDTLLLAMGILWAALAIGIELVRIELATVALVTHWALLLLAASLWIPGRKLLFADRNVALLAVAVVLTAVWAAAGRPDAAVAWASGLAAVLALFSLAVRPVRSDDDSTGQRALAVLAAPLAAGIWAYAGSAARLGILHPSFAAAALVAVAALLVGRRMPGPRGEWLERIIETFGIAFALGLATATLLDIARNAWAIGFELLCLAGLAAVAWIRTERRQTTDAVTVACALGLALILQANLLRWLGPAGDLDVTDVLDVRWPAVISLLWVAVACLLTVWSRKAGSRSLWIAGATLLVVSAVKLLIYDFGSLGELANILAVIAAGGIFLLVGWLAPMPPAAAREDRPAPPSPAGPPGPARAARQAAAVAPAAAASPAAPATASRATPASPESSRATGTVAILVGLAAVTYHFRDAGRALLDTILFDKPYRAEVTRPVRLKPAPRVTAAPAVIAEAPAPDEESGESDTAVYDLPAPVAEAEADHVPPPPAEGDAGLDQLRREGRIRPATPADLERWFAATGADRSAVHASTDPRSGGVHVFRTYVVLREMTFPEGLYGAHSATFIVPSGVPLPYGNAGHSRVLEMPR